MLTTCRLSEAARATLASTFGTPAVGAEAEFKELPYFLVTRSRTTWNFEKQDINSILLEQVTDRGLIVDPERGGDEPARLTLIPWTNVISFSVIRPTADLQPK